jgi:outer membrane receptor protein involved in Fe transport
VQLSSIDDIPADNIETIDVLKDPSSTPFMVRGAPMALS